MTRPSPRLTSSRMAKCAQVVPVIRSKSIAARSIRDVRGVLNSAAARTWLANVKSDSRNGLHSLNSGNRLCDSGRSASQHREDLIARTIGNELATFKHQDTVDEGQERQA